MRVAANAGNIFCPNKNGDRCECGLNVSGLALSSDGKLVGARYNNLNGFHGGAYGLFRFKKFAIQPEIIYSRQGQVYTTPNYSNFAQT